MGDITSANAIAIMIVSKIYPQGLYLQRFSTDQSISSDDVQLTETRMGVDGRMAAGYIPAIKPVSIAFEANSPSISSINFVAKMMETLRAPLDHKLIITVPSVGRIYTYTGGVLKNWKTFPDMKKILDPITGKWDFERLTVTSMGGINI